MGIAKVFRPMRLDADYQALNVPWIAPLLGLHGVCRLGRLVQVELDTSPESPYWRNWEVPWVYILMLVDQHLGRLNAPGLTTIDGATTVRDS